MRPSALAQHQLTSFGLTALGAMSSVAAVIDAVKALLFRPARIQEHGSK